METARYDAPYRRINAFILEGLLQMPHIATRLENCTLMAASHQAQGSFTSVWAIAWDWVLTPDGPRLLEGNSGWGTATPQQILGGFLADARR